MNKYLPITFLAFTMTACTWVKLTPDGEKVQIATASTVESCTKKGNTSVSLKADIAGFDRNHEKVKTELETLARNSAAKLDGDTIVPASKIENGEQSFHVYRCINP